MSVPKCRHALVYLGSEKPTDRQQLRKLQRVYNWVVWCLCSPVHSIKAPLFIEGHFFSESLVQSSSSLSFCLLLLIPSGTSFCDKLLLMVR